MKNGATCEFIVFPQSLDNNKMDIELEVADNGTINTYTTSLPSSTNNEFKCGYLYTYPIRINNTGVVIEKLALQHGSQVMSQIWTQYSNRNTGLVSLAAH